MTEMRTEVWNGHTIRFVEKEPGDWWAVAADVARATGYTPISEFLYDGEHITDICTIGDHGEYIAVTNKERLLLVNHWYGDSDDVIVPNVARLVSSIIERNDNLSSALANVLRKLLDRHYMFPSRSTLPNQLRVAIEKAIEYKPKPAKRIIDRIGDNREQKEFVYFLTADNGLTKIGRTKNLDGRIHHFTVKLPYELVETLVLITSDSNKLESELHSLFANKRVRGEWFRLTDYDIKMVRDRYRNAIYKKHA